MDSTLLLLQFTSQNIALFCCALFAGAATYVSLVEHPAMTEGGAKLASTYLLTSHPRPVVFQTSFGAIGSIAGILAGLAGGAPSWAARALEGLLTSSFQSSNAQFSTIWPPMGIGKGGI